MSKINMDIKALQLAARFSLPPNSLGYCGRDSAPEKFKKCAITGKCNGVKEELTKFIVLHPYLKTIGQITNKSKFSYDVIESYCIGNDLLNEAKEEHYNVLLDNFLEQGVPEWLVEELKQELPKKFIPHHLFQVLHVGVGRASGSVPYNIETINNCMIRWGSIESITGADATITLKSLKERENKHTLTTLRESHPFNNKLVTDIKKGDIVAVHWGQIITKLTNEHEEKLSYWTSKVLEALYI